MWQIALGVVLMRKVLPHKLTYLLPYVELECSNNPAQNYSPRVGEGQSLQHSGCSLGSKDYPIACLFS